MGSTCDKGIGMHTYAYLALYKNAYMCVCGEICNAVCTLLAIMPVFVLVKDISAAFMNIRAHQISLHGFKMPQSCLSKVILPERREVDLFFFLSAEIHMSYYSGTYKFSAGYVL